MTTYFDDNKEAWSIFADIINHNSISLRLIEFILIKCRSLGFRPTDNRHKQWCDIYSEFSVHRKRGLSIFCRTSTGDEKKAVTKHGRTILTTNSQMLFFQWAIQTNIIDYIIKNRAYFKTTMRSVKRQALQSHGTQRKRLKKEPLPTLAIPPTNTHHTITL